MLYGADGHLSRSVSGGSVAGVGGNDSASESEREEVSERASERSSELVTRRVLRVKR